MRGIVWAVAVIGVGTFAFGGCKPKVGGKCTSGQEVCTDKANGLACGSDNKFYSISCGGPDGCKSGSSGFTCDNSLASAGDGCETDDDVSCSTDKKAALECHNNKFEVGSTCKGPKGCVLDGDKISCDDDVADENDPCHFDDDYACTSDKQRVLRCKDKKMVAYNACRGPNGCVIKEEPVEHKIEFECDDTVAQVGDACDTEGNPACSVDKANLLQCKSGTFQQHRACAGCSYDSHSERFFCGGTAAGNHTGNHHTGHLAGGTAGGNLATSGSAHPATSGATAASAHAPAGSASHGTTPAASASHAPAAASASAHH